VNIEYKSTLERKKKRKKIKVHKP
jgi:hypothetical protein